MSGLDTPRRGVVTPLGRWCRDRRVSYQALGDAVGLSRSAIIRLCVGRSLPSALAALALVRETGLPLAELLGQVVTPPRAGAMGSGRPAGAMR